MESLSGWLNDNKYELLSHENGNELLKIRDMNNKTRKLLKVMNVRELDQKVVEEVVTIMKIVNNMNIYGLMKYKIIEMKGECLYRVMREYKTHIDIINPLKYFEESGVFEVLNGILNVLKSLNENGTIHSDLKPSNIFLNDENEVIISDYCNNSLYKGREKKKQLGSEEDLCFVCYDELLGKELDISSDIWNFGLIFYYIKSGKYPFIGRNMLETIMNILNVKYVPLKCENGDEVNSFLRRILQNEKKDRLKLDEIICELKKLNEAELPVIPFEVDEEMKKTIDERIDKCKKHHKYLLDFHGLKMKDEGMKYLCSRLNTMNNVTEIEINYSEVTSEGINTFSKCLKFFPNVDILSLNNNLFGNDSLKIFSEYLHCIPKLEYLSLNDNCLGNEDMKYLSSHFKDIPHLEELYFVVGKIGDKGVEYLCENLNEIPKLQKLGLCCNKIGDEGGEILLNNLHKCRELKVLWIFKNNISNYEDYIRRITVKYPNITEII